MKVLRHDKDYQIKWKNEDNIFKVIVKLFI